MSESFEKVMAEMADKVASPYWKRMADRLKIAHDRDIEHHMREQYHRGYESGRRSMDAEHYAVALKLRRIRFDGDSHANLSKIAYAVYPCATGWTCESCDGLRDEIIRLLGGVHDEPVSMDAGRCSRSNDCDRRAGESGRVTYYDELDNERHEAVCELRRWIDADGEFYPEIFFDGLFEMLGCEERFGKNSGEQMCDRLIHLLGGDEPYSNLTRTILEPNLPKSAETAKPESEDGGKVTITDELMERIAGVCKVSGLSGEKLYGIADRIDAQFRRVCWQQEAVLQKTIDDAADECNRLIEERDELRKSLRNIAEHAGVPHDRDLSDYSDETVIDAIYWRIDNFYQVNIDDLQAQVIECCEQRDKAREKAISLRNSLCDTQRRVKVKCDELQRVLNAIRAVVLDE